MKVIWHNDFEATCPQCGEHHNLGTAQFVVKKFYEPIEIEIPCGHKITATMITKNEGKKVCSYSQLDMYLKCPYNWKLKYKDKIIIEIVSIALEYGLVHHETLEDFFNNLKLGELLTIDDLSLIFDMYFANHKIPYEDVDTMLNDYEEGLVMIKRLINKASKLDELMLNSELVGVEMPFEVLIEGIVIVGYIDLVVRDKEGKLIIIDHKSGKTLYTKDKLECNLQFPIYSMAIFESTGELADTCYYNFTKLHKMQEVKVSRIRIEESKKEIRRIFAKMNGEKHTARPQFLCYWCDYSMYKGNQCKYSSDFKPKGK